jgi:hypothetical protein
VIVFHGGLWDASSLKLHIRATRIEAAMVCGDWNRGIVNQNAAAALSPQAFFLAGERTVDIC